MDLLALADFNLVARHGGFGAAARASGRPKATLSRHVAALETSLGVRLLERGAGRPKLTEEGRALHERTAALLGEIDEVADRVASGTETVRGWLRVSAPVQFANALLGRIAAEFCRAHPLVRVEVTAEDRAVDLVEEGYDVVIRVNPGEGDGLVGRCILRDRMLVVAAPSLRRPDDGDPVAAILLGATDAARPWVIMGDGGETTLPLLPVLRLSSLLLIRDAAVAGAGAALLPESLAGGDIAGGRLVCWGAAVGESRELWAMHASRRLPSARVSAFMAHLAAAFPSGMPADLVPRGGRVKAPGRPAPRPEAQELC